MEKKFHMTFGLKLVLLVLLMSIALSVAALISTYFTFFLWNVGIYIETGNTLAKTAASQVSVEELDRYFSLIDLEDLERTRYTYQPDNRYQDVQNFLMDLAVNSEASEIYIVRAVEGIGLVILFDSAYSSEDDPGSTPLGDTYMSEAISGYLDEMLLGNVNDSVVDPDDPDYGTVLTVIFHIPGRPAYYAMADIPVGEVWMRQNNYIFVTAVLLAVLTLIFVVIYLLVIRFGFARPLARITQAAQSCGAGAGPEAFDGLKFKGSYELQTLADNFRNMLLEIRENSKREQDLAVREQRLQVEMGLANDLKMAVLPRQLPQREREYPFQVQGLICQGEGLTCCFYDYFLLPLNRLCVIIGETRGRGVHELLFTAMAQAAIKSRLLSDLTLAETMTSANRQIYDMGGDMELYVLAGILDGATGCFSYVNAGQRPPLIMRDQERYDWVDAFPSAPLGQSENVAYQVMELRLRQGNRLFFRTGERDAPYGRNVGDSVDEQIRLFLNEKNVRQADLEQQLQLISDAVDSYASQSGRTEGSAMLALEYCRRDKAQAHCVLTADASSAAQLKTFLRGQMHANGIAGHQAEHIVVLGDELLALCARKSHSDDRFLAECAVQNERVTLRIRGDLGARDPLTDQPEGPGRQAVDYWRRSCEDLFFEHSSSMDTVTLVTRLSPDDTGALVSV